MSRNIILMIIIGFSMMACSDNKNHDLQSSRDWKKRQIRLSDKQSAVQKSTYLSVYSEIYSLTEKRTHDLTVTVSMRNTSSVDSVFILRADYHNTVGKLKRSYLDKPIYNRPLETLEIVIEENDREGGSGANFIFRWAAKDKKVEPLFEAVMISTSGQQGISFVTRGINRQE